MKIKTNYPMNNYKIVNYFGLDFTVNENTNYLAVDANGYLYSYQLKNDNKPEVDNDSSMWVMEDGKYDFVCEVDLEGLDWKDTLVEIKVLQN